MEVYLHKSYEFLLAFRSPKSVPSNRKLFTSYFAGLIDSEGSIGIVRERKKKDHLKFYISVGISEISIILKVKEMLKELHYHPSLSVRHAEKYNELNPPIRTKKDQWVINIQRKPEVIDLCKKLPIRHRERIMRRNLILKLQNKTYWCKEVQNEREKLYEAISLERKICMKAAILALREIENKLTKRKSLTVEQFWKYINRVRD